MRKVSVKAEILAACARMPGMFMMPYVMRLSRNSFPLGVILVVLSCAIVYFGFQAQDEKRFERMGEFYASSVMPGLELPAYAEYLRKQGERDKLAKMDEFKREKALFPALRTMQGDVVFMAALRADKIIMESHAQFYDWRSARRQFDAMQTRLFTERFHFDSEHPRWLTAFTHQFMHGSTGHLLGNMLVLILVGVAVEALIGTLPFLCVFLLGGLGAVATHWLVTQGAAGGLVGASGAISAIMGAFAVVLGMRRIPFFYSLIVYFDVIRAPALLALPIWLINEAVQFFWLGNAHVAYGAHFGGLVVGALLVLPLRRRALARLPSNEELAAAPTGQAKSTQSAAALALHEARRLMSQQRFDDARRAYARAAAHAPADLALLRECLNVAKLAPASVEYHAIMGLTLSLRSSSTEAQSLVLEAFRDYLQKAKPLPQISPETAAQLIERFSQTRCLPELSRTARLLHASAHPQREALLAQAVHILRNAGDAQGASELAKLQA